MGKLLKLSSEEISELNYQAKLQESTHGDSRPEIAQTEVTGRNDYLKSVVSAVRFNGGNKNEAIGAALSYDKSEYHGNSQPLFSDPSEFGGCVDALINAKRFVDSIYGSLKFVIENEVTRLNIFAWCVKDAYQGEAKEFGRLTSRIPYACYHLDASQGGSGKSQAMMQLGLAVSNPPKSTGNLCLNNFTPRYGQVFEYGSAVFITSEDNKDEVHRRLEKSDPNYHENESFYVVPLPDAGGAITLFQSDKEHGLSTTPAFNKLREQLSEIPELKLVMFDPLASFSGVDENLNHNAQYIAMEFSCLATELDCTVLVSHHVNKLGKDKTTKNTLDRERVRGASALVDGSRGVTLTVPVCDDDAKKMCDIAKVPFTPDRAFKTRVVKANGNLDKTTSYTVFDNNGVLLDVTHEFKNEMKISQQAMEEAILASIQHGTDHRLPFTLTGKRSLYSRCQNGHTHPDLHKFSDRQLRQSLTELLNACRLVKGKYGCISVDYDSISDIRQLKGTELDNAIEQFPEFNH